MRKFDLLWPLEALFWLALVSARGFSSVYNRRLILNSPNSRELPTTSCGSSCRNLQLRAADVFKDTIPEKEEEKDDSKKLVGEEYCPRGYFLDEVQNQCRALGPLGRASQIVESSWAPFQRASRAISNLFGIDAERISNLGVGFALSYAILSTINGAISLSCAWFLSCRRVSLFSFHDLLD